MTKRTLTDKVKDHEGLINTIADSVPMTAVRKLYRLTKDLATKLESIEVQLEPSDVNMKSHEQDLEVLLKEISELKKENEELKSDKWYTPLWNR